MRLLLALVALSILPGCSVRPIPDDVVGIPTEDIVRSMRCETKFAVRDRITYELKAIGSGDIESEHVLEPRNLERIRRRDAKLAAKLLAYGASSIAYRFEFMISENNDASGALGFKVPFTTGAFDLAATADYKRQRDGLRRFETVETFADLAKLKCHDFVVRDAHLHYPISGSIGMTKAVNTFVELTEFGGAKGEFTDTLNFTTTLNGSIKPSLVLNPVPQSFRLVNASGEVSAGRTDKHSVTISFAFPTVDLREIEVDRPSGREKASVLFNPEALKRITQESVERAKENLCIARGLDREALAGSLRLYPPELYCRKPTAIALPLPVQ
jgi:hypothetical protein